MAQPYVSGPAHIYVGFKTSPDPTVPGTMFFLGHAERSPKISVRPQYSPVFVSLGGTVPFDWTYQGEEALIVANLTRWNENIYQAIAAKGRGPAALAAGGASGRGIDLAGEIGSLMVHERIGVTLTLVFPYATKAAMAGQPLGYRFIFAQLENDELDRLGTEARSIPLVFRAARSFNSATGSFVLFDHNITGIPPIN